MLDEFIKITDDFAKMLKILSRVFSLIVACYILLAHGFTFTVPNKIESISKFASRDNIVFSLLSIVIYTLLLIALPVTLYILKLVSKFFTRQRSLSKKIVLTAFRNMYDIEAEPFLKKINYEVIRLSIYSVVENWMYLMILLIAFHRSFATILLFLISLIIGVFAIVAADFFREWIIELRAKNKSELPFTEKSLDITNSTNS
jgi:hypothetical protein